MNRWMRPSSRVSTRPYSRGAEWRWRIRVAAARPVSYTHLDVYKRQDYAGLKIVDELAVENYGVAFRQGSDVRDAVNEIFADMVADGSLGALADKYGLELAD